ncbi:MAG: hypothetical protein COA79_13120 [Planctomycetota bacterium]|nr:MAG: hypothetical protein COA79_13120 [Planctomycetota bacterium]
MAAQSKKTIYLIDGTSWLFKGYFAVDYRESIKGVPNNAVFGWCMIAFKFLRLYQPTHVSVLFDAGLKTFRNKIYPDYKANRGLPPEDLKPQFKLCQKAADIMGFHYELRKEFEADDLIASMATLYEKKGFNVIIVSVDKDLRQLVNENIKILDFKNEVILGVNEIYQKMGVYPHQVIDFQALTGDAIDNVPGLKGVGEKTAIEILKLNIPILKIIKNSDLLNSSKIRGLESLKNRLKCSKDEYLLSKELVTLKSNIKSDWSVKNLKYRKINKSKSSLFFNNMGFTRMVKMSENYYE